MNRRRRAALALAVPLALLATGCTGASGTNSDAKPTPHSPASAAPSGSGLSLTEAIDRLHTAREHEAGYDRERFHHWIDADHDGCDTRHEVLLDEAVKKPRQGADCDLTGGQWRSAYDGKTVTDDGDLDIDHMVPLAEAWASGASTWSAAKRERYANDLGVPTSLIAVTLSTNRSKGDQDVAEWLPPAKADRCTYTADWVATKLRWNLTIDDKEHEALQDLARDCPKATVTVQLAH